MLAVGDGVTGVVEGNLAACAGAGYANHGKVVAVPINLCVKLSPDAVHFRGRGAGLLIQTNLLAKRNEAH